MGKEGGRGWMVNDVDYTAEDGVEVSCKDGCGAVVSVRKDLVINRVSKYILCCFSPENEVKYVW